MKSVFEIALVAIIILVIYLQPYALSEFSQSTIGKIIFLIFIIMLASKNSLAGFLGALFFIALLENPKYFKLQEGLNNMSSSSSASSKDNIKSKDDKQAWVVKNLCKTQDNGDWACPVSTPGGECVPEKNIETTFTGLDFPNGGCNFCGTDGPTCEWSVEDDEITAETKITGDDQLHTEESLRSVSS